MRYIKFLLGALLLIGLLYFVDTKELVASFANLTWSWITILLLITWCLLAVSVIKWQLFLKKLGTPQSFWYLFKLYLVGYFVNLVMPSYVGGDLVRGLYAGNSNSKHESLSATFLERYTGLIMMILMALVAVHFAPSTTFEMRAAVWLVAFSLCVGTCLVYSKDLLECLPLPTKLFLALTRFQEGLKLGVSDKKLLFYSLALSLLFHLITVLNTWAVAEAVGWSGSSLLDLTSVVPLILIIGALPVSPQGLGIQEGAFFFFLRQIGAPEGVALAVPLVLRAKSYFLALLGGIVWMGLPTVNSDRSNSQSV